MDNYSDLSKKFFFDNSYMESSSLYHYTSLSALQSIVENKELWLTNADFVNDVSEGKYLIELYKEVLKEFESKNNCAEDLKAFLHSENLFKIETTYLKSGNDFLTGNIGIDEADIYICCFSTEKDSLPMWNYYGNSAQGINIEFHRNTFDFNDEFIKVIYDIEEQKTLLKEKLIILSQEWDCDEKRKTHVKWFFYDFLKRMLYTCKHPCFSYENEVRLIIKVAKKDTEPVFVKVNNSGQLIPHIDHSIKDTLIQSITLSPLCNFSLVNTALQILFQKNEIVNCDIEQSKCPIQW